MPQQRNMEFQELVTRHMCGQCDGVLTDPVQLPCGHLVCECCFVELFADKTEAICKIDKCGKGINKSEVFPDMCYRREIQNLKVYCTNKEHGCAEVIPWKMLQDHILTNCKYVQKNTPCGTELSNIQDEKYQRAEHGTYREFLVREDISFAKTTPVVKKAVSPTMW